MKIEKKHICKHCGKEFKWYYQVPQKYGSKLEVEIIPKDKAGVYSVVQSEERNGYKIPLEVTVYCSKCDYLNNIIGSFYYAKFDKILHLHVKYYGDCCQRINMKVIRRRHQNISK